MKIKCYKEALIVTKRHCRWEKMPNQMQKPCLQQSEAFNFVFTSAYKAKGEIL